MAKGGKKGQAVAAPDSVSLGDAVFGGSAVATWSGGDAYEQVYIAVTLERNADTVIAPDNDPHPLYDVWLDVKDFGGYQLESVTFDFPGSAWVWQGGSATGTARLMAAVYTHPPAGSDRTWVELASVPVTVAA